jgi:hypothetical protein
VHKKWNAICYGFEISMAREICQKYGNNNVLVIDSTFGTNQYKMVLSLQGIGLFAARVYCDVDASHQICRKLYHIFYSRFVVLVDVSLDTNLDA